MSKIISDKVIPEKIHLLQVNIIKSSINTSKDYLDKPVDASSIKLLIGKEIAHNFDEGMARYRLYFKCIGLNDNETECGITAEFGIEFHFKIENFDEFIVKDSNENKIDVSIGTTLMAIAYSCSRGIILERTQSSAFNGIILPIIDSTKFLLEEERNVLLQQDSD